MLISGVHLYFFFHQKKRNYKLGDYKKEISQKSVAFQRNRKKKRKKKVVPTYPTPNPLGHLNVKEYLYESLNIFGSLESQGITIEKPQPMWNAESKAKKKC